jgi:hypothetical protein
MSDAGTGLSGQFSALAGRLASGDRACTLSVMASRFDVPYLELTIAHLVRACNYPFAERLLNMDVGCGAANRAYSGAATIAELLASAQRLCDRGVIDRIVTFDDKLCQNEALSRKHFGRRLRWSRDCRGVPLWGWINEFEACQTEYLVHFDCDMLLHQAPGHSWIADGMDLLKRRPDVMFALPLPGPPTADGRLFQKKDENYVRDDDGFFRFRSFTSRKFLVDRRRFEQLLPLRPLYISWKRRLWQHVTRKNALRNWETMVSRRLQSSPYVRADLASPNAWTLHSHDHGPEFQRLLPAIIERVESGFAPPEQAGFYDLKLKYWMS